MGKDGLLLRIAEGEGSDEALLPTYTSPTNEVVAFAETYGLHRSFLQLLMTLAPAREWRPLIEPLREGSDTAATARRWMAWVWSDPLTGQRSLVTTKELRAVGDSVFTMHARSSAGERVSRNEWRQTRAALENAVAENKVEAAALGVAAAASWDLDTAPGAAADMILAWRNTMFAKIDHDLMWNPDKEAASNARSEAIQAAADARIKADAADLRARGEDVDGESPEAAMLRMRRSHIAGAQDYVTANPSALDDRAELRQIGYLEIYRIARFGLLEAVRGLNRAYAAPADRATQS